MHFDWPAHESDWCAIPLFSPACASWVQIVDGKPVFSSRQSFSKLRPRITLWTKRRKIFAQHSFFIQTHPRGQGTSQPFLTPIVVFFHGRSARRNFELNKREELSLGIIHGQIFFMFSSRVRNYFSAALDESLSLKLVKVTKRLSFFDSLIAKVMTTAHFCRVRSSGAALEFCAHTPKYYQVTVGTCVLCVW